MRWIDILANPRKHPGITEFRYHTRSGVCGSAKNVTVPPIRAQLGAKATNDQPSASFFQLWIKGLI